MVKVNIQALLIEDSPTDAGLIVEGLEGSDVGAIDITHVETLKDAHGLLTKENGFNAILLDLGLPDSEGLDTLKRALEFTGDIPVIVLTGLYDDDIGREAVRLGADDFLTKGSTGVEKSALITRSICFSLERHKLRLETMANRARNHHDKQVTTLSAINAGEEEEPLALSEREQKKFQGFLQRYGDILDHLMEDGKEPTGYDMRNDLESLAVDMGALNAGPHDVVEVHSKMLKTMAKDLDAHGISALVDEGNVTSLGLMGMLVSYYRRTN